MSLGSGSPLAPSVSPPARWDGGQQCVLHEVTRFDTLAGIAIRYGAQVADIKKANRISTDSQISSHAGSSQQRTEQHGTGSSSPAATTSAAMASGSGSGGGAGSLSEAILQLVSAQAAAEHAEAHSRNLAAAEAAGRARASTFFFVQMREAEQYVSSEGEEPSPPCQRGTSLSEGEGDEGGRRLSWLGGGVGGFYSGAQGRGAGRSTWTGEARQTSAQEFGGQGRAQQRRIWGRQRGGGGRVVEDLLWRFHKSTSFSTFENAGLLNASAVAGGLTRSPLRRDPSGSLSAGIDLPSTRSWSRPSSVAAAVEVGGSGDGSVLLGCSTPIKGGEGGVCDDGSSTAVGGSAVYGSVTRRGVSSRRGKGVPADITG
ncbi:unnamed protein product [Closterium sp. NIES-65]|nr:unnamed protein product [Closterium sp. NIES-65]